MKPESSMRHLMVATAILLCLAAGAGNPVFQWSDWVAPESAKAMKNPLEGDKTATAAGEQLFNAICFVCHGNQGKGDGINAAALARKPADLTSRRVQRQSDGALFWKITEGNPPMLRFKETLSEEQRWQMVNYVRRLAELYPPEEAVAKNEKAALTPVAKKSPAATNAGSKKIIPEKEAAPVVAAVNPFQGISDGRQLFKTICSACHSIGQGKMVGPDLRGVNGRHDGAWLRKWIRSSQDLVKSGDAGAVRLFEENNRVVMTDHKFLTDAQIGNILEFVKNETARLSVSHKVATVSKIQPTAPAVRKASVYEKWVQYFWYAGFAFILFSLLMVVSILNKLAR